MFPPLSPYALTATRAMNVANAASCCLMKLRVVSSLISPVFSSSFEAQLPMKISGLLSTKASRNTIARRRSYCTRPPPNGPGEADCSATGLPANGWFCSRETQSMAFLRDREIVLGRDDDHAIGGADRVRQRIDRRREAA